MRRGLSVGSNEQSYSTQRPSSDVVPRDGSEYSAGLTYWGKLEHPEVTDPDVGRETCKLNTERPHAVWNLIR